MSISITAAGTSFAQTPPSVQQPAPSNNQAGSVPGYTLQVNAQAVVLDVVVTDKNGQTVNNLSKQDFQIYEDKAPQVIRTLDTPGSHLAMAPIAIHSTTELDKLERDAPVTIIVLDEINTRFEDEAFARYSLKKFLDTQGDVLQQPTLLVAVNLQRFVVVQDYTTSKQEILSALEHHLTAYPWHLESGSWKTQQFNAAFASLMEVAQATAGHPGHKSMIWIGRGLPTVDPMNLTPEANEALKTAIETCTNALRDARVVLYTLDPAGISDQGQTQDEEGFMEDDPFGGQVDFNAMAKATGGHAFYGRNDIDRLIGNSVRDAASFYTLSYTPSIPRTDTKAFHNIRVVMRNPGLHATTREGYYSQPPADSSASPEPKQPGKLSDRQIFDLTLAGQSMLVYDALPLTLVRLPASPDQFKIRFSSDLLPWQPNGSQKLEASVTLLVESFDRKGKLLNRKADTSTLQVAEGSTQNGPATPQITLLTSILTQAPAARIRFVVRANGNGKLGSSNFFLVDEKTLSDPAMDHRTADKPH